jgi:hypothetical protein
MTVVLVNIDGLYFFIIFRAIFYMTVGSEQLVEISQSDINITLDPY